MTGTTNGVSPTTLRILCVHDTNSNAFELKSEFRLLGNKLYENHSVDLVYVNGPLISSATIGTPSNDTNRQCVWWEEVGESTNSSIKDTTVNISSCDLQSTTSKNTDVANPDNEIDNLQQPQHSMLLDAPMQQTSLPETENLLQVSHSRKYIGLDASLMLLRQIWTSCPFWGIIGVGQGAAIASLFVTLLESETISYHVNHTMRGEDDVVLPLPLPPNLPQLMIFISGESLIQVDEPLLVSDHYNKNQTANEAFILHLVDSDITSEQELLMRQFSQCCQVEQREELPGTPAKSRRRITNRDLNIIGRFICQRKKGLYGTANNALATLLEYNKAQSEILGLQTALYNAEQDATNCIAETIALNPPAALMAVIRPQLVAGWIGNRRPQPDGGGAPCPEEFLHKEKYRT
jgi:Serine hydrolase (FSH1)